MRKELKGSELVFGHLCCPELGIDSVLAFDHVVEIEDFNLLVDFQTTLSDALAQKIIANKERGHGIEVGTTKGGVLFEDTRASLVGNFANGLANKIVEILGVSAVLVPAVDTEGSRNLVILEGGLNDLHSLGSVGTPDLVLIGFLDLVWPSDVFGDIFKKVGACKLTTQGAVPVGNVGFALEGDEARYLAHRVVTRGVACRSRCNVEVDYLGGCLVGRDATSRAMLGFCRLLATSRR